MSGERCKCWLLLPCHSCIGPVEDYLAGSNEHVYPESVRDVDMLGFSAAVGKAEQRLKEGRK